MRRSCFKTNALTRRGFAGFFKALTLSVMCLAAFADSVAYTVDENTKVATVTVPNPANDAQNRAALADLQAALDDETVMTVVLTHTITLPDGTYLSAGNTSPRKIVQVVAPFLPENGKVTLKTSSTADNAKLDTIDTPLDGSYSTYNLFDITAESHVTISNLTLKGGFEGQRIVDGDSTSAGGIDHAEGGEGFRRVRIAPRFLSALSFCRASQNTVNGEVSTEWTRNGDAVELSFRIPEGMTAEYDGRIYQAGEYRFESVF